MENALKRLLEISRKDAAIFEEFGELPTILRNVDLERIARGEGCQVTGCAVV